MSLYSSRTAHPQGPSHPPDAVQIAISCTGQDEKDQSQGYKQSETGEKSKVINGQPEINNKNNSNNNEKHPDETECHRRCA